VHEGLGHDRRRAAGAPSVPGLDHNLTPPGSAPDDTAALVRFYDEAYSLEPSRSAVYARWRALGAIGKADHVIGLCERSGISPASTLEVGCGDGALLCELHRRGFGGRLSGAEISEAAVSIARERIQIDDVALYDGVRLPLADGTHDLGILSHVLEHVCDPSALLAEVARVCRAVVVEVPLEANLSARRAHKRQHAAEVGHLLRLDRSAARQIVIGAGLSVACELDDPLPPTVHRFFSTTRRARVAANVKWALRAGLHRVAPSLARRSFSLHYACLALPKRVPTTGDSSAL
jgi:SAM-dependent methyltransferase